MNGGDAAKGGSETVFSGGAAYTTSIAALATLSVDTAALARAALNIAEEQPGGREKNVRFVAHI